MEKLGNDQLNILHNFQTDYLELVECLYKLKDNKLDEIQKENINIKLKILNDLISNIQFRINDMLCEFDTMKITRPEQKIEREEQDRFNAEMITKFLPLMLYYSINKKV